MKKWISFILALLMLASCLTAVAEEAPAHSWAFNDDWQIEFPAGVTTLDFFGDADSRTYMGSYIDPENEAIRGNVMVSASSIAFISQTERFDATSYRTMMDSYLDETGMNVMAQEVGATVVETEAEDYFMRRCTIATAMEGDMPAQQIEMVLIVYDGGLWVIVCTIYGEDAQPCVRLMDTMLHNIVPNGEPVAE